MAIRDISDHNGATPYFCIIPNTYLADDADIAAYIYIISDHRGATEPTFS